MTSVRFRSMALPMVICVLLTLLLSCHVNATAQQATPGMIASINIGTMERIMAPIIPQLTKIIMSMKTKEQSGSMFGATFGIDPIAFDGVRTPRARISIEGALIVFTIDQLDASFHSKWWYDAFFGLLTGGGDLSGVAYDLSFVVKVRLDLFSTIYNGTKASLTPVIMQTDVGQLSFELSGSVVMGIVNPILGMLHGEIRDGFLHQFRREVARRFSVITRKILDGLSFRFPFGSWGDIHLDARYHLANGHLYLLMEGETTNRRQPYTHGNMLQYSMELGGDALTPLQTPPDVAALTTTVFPTMLTTPMPITTDVVYELESGNQNDRGSSRAGNGAAAAAAVHAGGSRKSTFNTASNQSQEEQMIANSSNPTPTTNKHYQTPFKSETLPDFVSSIINSFTSDDHHSTPTPLSSGAINQAHRRNKRTSPSPSPTLFTTATTAKHTAENPSRTAHPPAPLAPPIPGILPLDTHSTDYRSYIAPYMGYMNPSLSRNLPLFSPPHGMRPLQHDMSTSNSQTIHTDKRKINGMQTNRNDRQLTLFNVDNSLDNAPTLQQSEPSVIRYTLDPFIFNSMFLTHYEVYLSSIYRRKVTRASGGTPWPLRMNSTAIPSENKGYWRSLLGDTVSSQSDNFLIEFHTTSTEPPVFSILKTSISPIYTSPSIPSEEESQSEHSNADNTTDNANIYPYFNWSSNTKETAAVISDVFGDNAQGEAPSNTLYDARVNLSPYIQLCLIKTGTSGAGSPFANDPRQNTSHLIGIHHDPRCYAAITVQARISISVSFSLHSPSQQRTNIILTPAQYHVSYHIVDKLPGVPYTEQELLKRAAPWLEYMFYTHLQTAATEVFRYGIPLPKVTGMQFTQASYSVTARHVNVYTDIEYDLDVGL